MKKLFIYLLSAIALTGCHKTMRPIHFNHLVLPSTPNYALAAYAGFPTPSHFVVKTYPIPQKELAEKLIDTLKDMPRIQSVKEDNKNYEYTFIQRTKFIRFPDWIDVKVYSIDDHTSTFVMLSRSQYGYSDFGVNKKRIQNFLQTFNSDAF